MPAVELDIPYGYSSFNQDIPEAPYPVNLGHNLEDILPMADVLRRFLQAHVQVA